MKKRETYPGKAYAVTTQSGCSVYADEAGAQLIKTIEAGQGYFVAIGSQTWVDDDAAIITETFNVAPMAASGGGGASITIDQTYSATSTNAQSGVAVSRALNTLNCKAEGYYVKIGTESLNGYSYSTNVGHKSTASDIGATSIGYNAHATASNSLAFGSNIRGSSTNTVAIGFNANNKDTGTVMLSANCPTTSTTYQTILYLVSAHSPLANKYENGEAFLGYVVRGTSGNIEACGTRKLSELLTNNTAFAPAAFGLDDEPTPGPFLPTGIMEPIELDEFPNN